MGDFGANWTPAALGNYDTNRLPVDLIIVHHTACPLSAAEARFQQPGTQVSAHFIVAQDGTIYETVPIGDTAYHSGNYEYNERSVGIEHESGPVGQDFFTDVQYAASQNLIKAIADHFGFPVDRTHVWPHNQVVATACPGVLNLSRLLSATPTPATEEVQVPGGVPGTVYDTPNNDRSFLDYDTVQFVPDQIAPTGTKITWDKAKFVNGKWLDHIAGGSWALYDDCVDDGGFDPPHFVPAPSPPPVAPPPPPPVVIPLVLHKRNPEGDPNDPIEDHNADILPS